MAHLSRAIAGAALVALVALAIASRVRDRAEPPRRSLEDERIAALERAHRIQQHVEALRRQVDELLHEPALPQAPSDDLAAARARLEELRCRQRELVAFARREPRPDCTGRVTRDCLFDARACH